MADYRIHLPDQYKLVSGNRTYTIEKYISAGSNSIVYQAWYQDTLMPEHIHTVLVKELYPLDDQERIIRDESMALVIPEEAVSLFEYHKASFLQGNQAHLALAKKGRGHIAENLDSFEANHTLYTILTARKGGGLFRASEGRAAFSHIDGCRTVLPQPSVCPEALP